MEEGVCREIAPDGSTTGFRVRGDGLLHDEYVLVPGYRGVFYGLELEFFTVDRDTLLPRDCLDSVAAHPQFGVFVTPELAAEQVEVKTPPTAILQNHEDLLLDLCADLNSVLAREGAMVLPIALYDTAPLTVGASARGSVLASVLGRNFEEHGVTIASDQINIGAGDEANAFRIYSAVSALLPLLMELSAASPFSAGRPNGVAANRMDVYDAALEGFPGASGFPPPMEGLAAYATHLAEQAFFQHPTTSYKYVRPMPQRGVAAEIRCLDKQPTIADTMALLALCKAVVNRVSAGDVGSDSLLALAHAEKAFQRARREGGAPPIGTRVLLEELAMWLDARERHYLAPLLARLDRGSPAREMRERERRVGLGNLYREIAAGSVRRGG